MKTLLVFLMAMTSQAWAAPALNPDVSQGSIRTTICQRGYTKKVRPPVVYTNKVKRKLMIDAGIPLRQISRYELDHVVPLELGGHPRALANLKLQLWPEARVKDKLENRLNRLVCQGKMPLEEARNCIYDDWKSCSLTH